MKKLLIILILIIILLSFSSCEKEVELMLESPNDFSSYQQNSISPAGDFFEDEEDITSDEQQEEFIDEIPPLAETPEETEPIIEDPPKPEIIEEIEEIVPLEEPVVENPPVIEPLPPAEPEPEPIPEVVPPVVEIIEQPVIPEPIKEDIPVIEKIPPVENPTVVYIDGVPITITTKSGSMDLSQGIDSPDILHKGIYSPLNPPKPLTFHNLYYNIFDVMQMFFLNGYTKPLVETETKDFEAALNIVNYTQIFDIAHGQARLQQLMDTGYDINTMFGTEIRYDYYIYQKDIVNRIVLMWIEHGQFFILEMPLHEAGPDMGISFANMYLTENQIIQ